MAVQEKSGRLAKAEEEFTRKCGVLNQVFDAVSLDHCEHQRASIGHSCNSNDKLVKVNCHRYKRGDKCGCLFY